MACLLVDLQARSTLVRRSRAILVIFGATFLVNGAADASGRLHPKRLLDIGLPTDPVVWLTALGVFTLLVGALALRVVELHVEGLRTAQYGYVLACAAGAVGLVVLAAAPEELSGSAAVLLVAGIAMPLTRTIGSIWVNRQTSADVRATVHSFLAQAEYLGEIACGFAIAAVAQFAGLSAALVAGAALFVVTIVLVEGFGTSRPVPPTAAPDSAHTVMTTLPRACVVPR